MNPGMGQREALASGFLGLTTQPEAAPAPLQTPGVVVTEVRGQAQVQGTNAGGVISGVIRAVQTLPGAVETLVGRAGSGRSAPGTPGQQDGVEYASVRSTPERGQSVSPGNVTESPTPFADPRILEQLQRLPERAPLLYPRESQAYPSPPRPPSTSSSDVQAEVRRQLSELMALRDEESRRLRAQVEALSMENHSLRLRVDSSVQQGMLSSRPEGGVGSGIPGLSWLGRGLGSLMGHSRQERVPDLGYPPPPPPPVEAPLYPRALDFQAAPRTGAPPGALMDRISQQQGAPDVSSGYPDHPNGLGYPAVHPNQGVVEGNRTSGSTSRDVNHPYASAGTAQASPIPQPRQIPMSSGSNDPHLPQPPPPSQVPTTMPAGGQPAANAQSSLPQEHQDPVSKGVQQDTPGVTGSGASDLDAMSVVLTGMAQLQSVVSELASPKASDKPEVIKPGVLSLPELPGHGPESCLAFADWLHVTRPALADVSDTSERLWELVVEEATQWYASYLKLGPLDRLSAKPKPSPELSQPKWARVSRRIESMINSAAPAAVREEISSSRTSGLLSLVCKLFVIYGPGSVTERELGLKHIADPPACSGIPETIEGLRRWRRWCSRMTELGGILPDSAIQVRALTKITRAVLLQNHDAAFRINLARAELQVDLVPDSDKVMKLHAQMLSELESMAHRGERDRDKPPKDTPSLPQSPPKVKGVEAQGGADAQQGPKTPRVPKSSPKGPPAPKAGDQGAASPSKIPCTFYSGPNGCKKGSECAFEHNWAAFSAAEKASRCKTCGSKSHKAGDCKAGSKNEERAKARPPRPQGNPKPGADTVHQTSQPSQGADANQQHIKSMLADAARFLQQTIPQQGPPVSDPVQQATAVPIPTSPPPPNPKASTQTPVQGAPVTLASLSAQLDSLRAMVGNPEIRTCKWEPPDDLEASTGTFIGGRPAFWELVERYEAKVCRDCPSMPTISTALLDSGATHAVIPYDPELKNLEKVPVTLAGDAKQEWWRTQGGTLVVPPPVDRTVESSQGQTILPLGALVEHLGCQVSWSKRQGLKVVHPTLGILKTGISGNTCPYVQEGQALQLIAELEANRLETLKEQVENLQCKLEESMQPPDPTEALRKYARTGERRDGLAALLAQPYFQGLPEALIASLAEAIPKSGEDEGRALLKRLPLKRAARRALLSAPLWAVHLSSGRPRDGNPLASWSAERGVAFLPIDLLEKGGKGWDLTKQDSVWKVLLWAASEGRIGVIFSSPLGTVTDASRS